MWVGFRKVLTSLLRFGRLPNHIAIIMDGNRRYAARKSLGALGGHDVGYLKLVEVIHWCLDLGVSEISVFAFSIANFKRTTKEVDGLMKLSEEKYMEMMEDSGLASKYGVVVRILGDLSLVPESVKQAAARLVLYCRDIEAKRKTIVNICFSYTSSQEVCHAVSAVHTGLNSHFLEVNDVDATLLEHCLYMKHSTSIDLLIRTSGETRLSDFLLWQCRYALLVFTDVLWPEYSFLDFISALVQFQGKALQLDELRCNRIGDSSCEGPHCPSDVCNCEDHRPERIKNFLQARESQFLKWLEEHGGSNP